MKFRAGLIKYNTYPGRQTFPACGQYVFLRPAMARPFHFKTFSIRQEANAQKVGTDSMLLGAWTGSGFKNILDVGTGTGILALMMAQENPQAKITAIEPEPEFLAEALVNFSNPAYAVRLTGIRSSLQAFDSTEKFDLIICNPPYFENSSKSENAAKNQVRHNDVLPLQDLYQCAGKLLLRPGNLNVIFPFESEKQHFEVAKQAGFFPARILRTHREDGTFKRTLVSYSFDAGTPVVEELLVKYSNNTYSTQYIELTRKFYGKDLSGE
jgi:tRNA1Val (adenine37-N6)-methyltransferase